MQGIGREHLGHGFEEQDFIEQKPGLAVFATDHVAGDEVQQGLEGNDRGRDGGACRRMVRLPPAQFIPDHPLLRVEQRLANQEMSVVHGRPWAGCRA